MRVDSTLAVHGMHCAGCAQRAAAAARRIDGVAQATADHITGRVRVVFDPKRVDDQRITRHLARPASSPRRQASRDDHARPSTQR